MSRVDWSKAGVRIRWQPPKDGRNPDWDWVGQRWKDEADYYGEELTYARIVEMTACARCDATQHQLCADYSGRDMEGPHRERRRAAGEIMLRTQGPRFTNAAR